MPNPPQPARKRQALHQQGTLNPWPQGVTHALFQHSDFFDPRDLLQVKYEMLRQARVENQPVRQAAAAFGFSRPSFYQAQAALERGGLPGLPPRKRAPRRAHNLTADVMKFLVQARGAAPSLSTQELVQQVENHFGVRVHPRSIERRLRQQGKKRRLRPHCFSSPRRGGR